MQHAYTYHEQATAHGLPFAFLGHPDGSVRLHGSLLPLPQGEAEAYLVDATVGNAEQLVNAVAAYASGPWECIVIGECSDAAAKRLTTAYPQQVRLAGVAEHLSILSGAAESYVRHFIAYVADAHLSPNDLRTASDNEDLTVLLLADGKLSPAKESCRMTKEEIAAFMRHQTETIVRLAPRYA